MDLTKRLEEIMQQAVDSCEVAGIRSSAFIRRQSQ